jgi:hypothetical protein
VLAEPPDALPGAVVRANSSALRGRFAAPQGEVPQWQAVLPMGNILWAKPSSSEACLMRGTVETARDDRLLTTAIFVKILFAAFPLQKNQIHGMVNHRWMKGALTRPTKNGRIRLAIGETEGIRLEGRGCEILLRHEGLAPVRLSKGSSRIGLLNGRILAGRRIDWPVFFPGPRSPGS